MKKIIYFLAIVCFFSGLTAFKAPPPPAIVTDIHLDFCGPFTDTNPCNGELVTSTGCYGIDDHFVQNGNRLNISVHASGHLDGAGDQGNTYNVNETENLIVNGSLTNGQFEVNDVFNLEFISKGGAPNFVVHLSFHVTYNANGTITVVKTTSSTDCRG